MIRRLRLRFILLAMLSVLLVLTIIMGAINILNYREVLVDADTILDYLQANNGEFPRPGQNGEPEPDSTRPAPPDIPDQNVQNMETESTDTASSDLDASTDVSGTDAGSKTVAAGEAAADINGTMVETTAIRVEETAAEQDAGTDASVADAVSKSAIAGETTAGIDGTAVETTAIRVGMIAANTMSFIQTGAEVGAPGGSKSETESRERNPGNSASGGGNQNINSGNSVGGSGKEGSGASNAGSGTGRGNGNSNTAGSGGTENQNAGSGTTEPPASQGQGEDPYSQNSGTSGDAGSQQSDASSDSAQNTDPREAREEAGSQTQNSSPATGKDDLSGSGDPSVAGGTGNESTGAGNASSGESESGTSDRDVPQSGSSEAEDENDEDDEDDENDGDESGPDDRDLKRRRETISKETPFESRYFTVLIDENGEVVSTNIGNIASVSESKAQEYALQVYEQNSERGFSGYYRYSSAAVEEGTRIIFLDCKRSLSNFKSFLVYSLLVSAIGYLTVLLLVLLLSGRVIRPVQESYEKQKRFITDAGHELKTPLTIIDADVAIVEMEHGPSEWVDDIRGQTKRLTQLTNDLIFLSKMEEEQTTLSKIEFPISDMVSETAQSFRSRAQVEEKTFRMNIEPMLSYEGDEARIRQLVTILLDNALKYSEKDGTVELNLARQGKAVILSVFNTTSEMKKEDLTHLFDRFYRTDRSRNSATGGHGIGLSIALAIVNAHKGRITADSEDGKSLKITVTL